MKHLILFTLLICLLSPLAKADSPIKADKNTVTIRPKVYEKAFPNPLKGFRSGNLNKEDYPTLTRLYIGWNEIENNEKDGIDKIKAYSNSQWKDLPVRNIKVIPRVYLEWPYGTQNAAHSRDTVRSDWGEVRYCERFWPADMKRGDYNSEQFKKRLVNLIAKMGKAWDNDPCVAYIEMGLIGWWGEQHSPFINAEMQKLIGDAFVASFKNKLIMVRQAKDFTAYPFGSYWDSFAHASQTNEAEMLIAQDGKWNTSVRGGEVAYDWGDMSKTGTNPNESLKVKANRDYIIDYIRKVHCNHLGWINIYKTDNDQVKQGADILQQNLGYRFILKEVTYTSNAEPGQPLKVSFTVCNTGSSPFYYNWPVEVSLLDTNTHQPVWKSVFQGVDIRTWLPGDQWDTALRKYTIEPAVNSVKGEFQLPQELSKGEYIVALSILDPGGNVPAIRFAINNYFKGGRHPVGKIGIGKTITSVTLDETIFDDLYSDRTLYYEPGLGK
ncbi:MAG TPA: DUF4832 domain-containing protein [Prolixibacteraceae bacterium]|nr:DUF4832 domain-containing protein [Prolixibacteraceae bacterium]